MIARAAEQRYQELCDIASLVNVTLDQKLLLKSLLSRKQTFLFMNQKQRAISVDPSASSDETDGDLNSVMPYS